MLATLMVTDSMAANLYQSLADELADAIHGGRLQPVRACRPCAAWPRSASSA